MIRQGGFERFQNSMKGFYFESKFFGNSFWSKMPVWFLQLKSLSRALNWRKGVVRESYIFFYVKVPIFPYVQKVPSNLNHLVSKIHFNARLQALFFSISWQATALHFLGHSKKKSLILILKSKSCWSQWSECHYQSFLPTSKLSFPVTP